MLGIAGMHVAAADGYLCHGGVEVLVFEFADLAAVHGVGPVGPESLHIEFVGTLAYLLVGVEGNADVAVLYFGMGFQISHGGDDFSYAGFVVGTQKGVAVGNNERLAYIVFELGKFCGREHNAFFGVEGDLASVVVLHYAG